jgi:hypothetical protein
MIARIVEFEPDRHITGVSLPGPSAVFGMMTLTYQVTATEHGSRLVACLDVSTRSRVERLRTDLLTAGDLVMMRKQLLTLKSLAEGMVAPYGSVPKKS